MRDPATPYCSFEKKRKPQFMLHIYNKHPLLDDITFGIWDHSINPLQWTGLISAAAALSVRTSGFQLLTTQKNAPINNGSNQNTNGDSKTRGCERAWQADYHRWCEYLQCKRRSNLLRHDPLSILISLKKEQRLYLSNEFRCFERVPFRPRPQKWGF